MATQTPTKHEPNARHEPMAAAEYHKHPAIGASMLEDFRKSRRLYYGLHVANELEPKAETDAMLLGTLVHLRLLEPAKFVSTVDTLPEKAEGGKEWNWRLKAHREERDARIAKAEQDGHLCIPPELMAEVEEIASSIEANKVASKILTQKGEPEFPIFWTDPETGLELKCLVDWFAEVPLDLKTTNDPSPSAYARTCVNFGYHRKFAHYAAGLYYYCGKPKDFVHLAIGTTKPYTIGQYQIMDRDKDGRSLGKSQRRRMLHELARCYETGDWREPWEKGIIDLELPPFAWSEESYLL